MLCNVLNDCFYAGETYRMAVYAIQSDGQALNLTGYTSAMKLKKPTDEWSDAALSLTSTPAAGLTITAATGRVDVQIESSQSEDLEGQYDYKLEITSSGGIVTRLLAGTLSITA